MQLYTCKETIIVIKKISVMERNSNMLKIYMDGGICTTLGAETEEACIQEQQKLIEAMLEE